MSPRLPKWMVLVAALALAGCSAPTLGPDRPASHIYATADYKAPGARVRMQQRLAAVAFPLLRSALPLCGDSTRPSHGLSVAAEYPFADVNEYAFGERTRRGATSRILYTVPDSPAHQAGLRGGDEILSANGVNTRRKGSKILFRAMRDGGYAPLRLLVRRGSEERAVKIVPVTICATPVILASTQEVASWSTRSKIKVGEGMVRFARSDTELALVVAHELSHIILNHTGAFFGHGSPRLENDADYLGLYLIAGAGYNPHQALGLFSRMAAAFPDLDGMQPYPTTARRCAALVQTIEEIEELRAAGLDLVPDRKIWRGRAQQRLEDASMQREFADRLPRIQPYAKTQPELARASAPKVAKRGAAACL